MPHISSAFPTMATFRAGLCLAFSAFVLALSQSAGAQQQPTSVLHPANQDLSAGTPVLHPANQNPSAGTPALLDAMTTELHRAFTSLGKQAPGKQDSEKQLPPYFLSYTVSDASYVAIRAQFGALVDSSASRMRVADVQVRLGDPKLDNTHGTHRSSAVNSLQLPLTDDREALGRSLWLATNTGYGTALDNYMRVKTEAQVRAKEEDTSPDFSQEAPQVSVGKAAPPVVVDKAAWEQRVRALSMVFRLCARKWRSVHITRLSGKRRIRCAWRPAVVLSVAGS